MPEDENKTEMVNTQPQATETEAQPAAQGDAAEKVTLPKADYEAMQAALKKANQEAAARRKELERAAAEQKAKEQAEMTELQKATAKAAELEAELNTLKQNDKKREIAAKVGLPPALALRLVGATDEELEQDAKAILASLPKPAAPNTGATAPGANGRQGETPAERRARLGF